MRRLAAAGVLVVALAAACAGGGERAGGERDGAAGTTAGETAAASTQTRAQAASRKPPTDEELRWLGRYSAWAAELGGALEELGGMHADEAALQRLLEGEEEARAAFEEQLAVVRRCLQTLRSEVGTIPSERLRDAWRLTARSCEHFRRGADADARGIRGQGETHFEEAGAEWQEATRLLAEARGELAQVEPRDGRPLPTIDRRAKASRVQPRYGEVAGGVVDREISVEVRCWSRQEWSELLRDLGLASGGQITDQTLGFTSIDQKRVNLAPWLCAALDGLVYGGERPREGQALADAVHGVLTLTHEAQHAAGTINEATAECYGLQRIRPAARTLGLERGYADLLAETAWTVVYPQQAELYRSPECTNGGVLDLDPASEVWP